MEGKREKMFPLLLLDLFIFFSNQVQRSSSSPPRLTNVLLQLSKYWILNKFAGNRKYRLQLQPFLGQDMLFLSSNLLDLAQYTSKPSFSIQEVFTFCCIFVGWMMVDLGCCRLILPRRHGEPPVGSYSKHLLRLGKVGVGVGVTAGACLLLRPSPQWITRRSLSQTKR